GLEADGNVLRLLTSDDQLACREADAAVRVRGREVVHAGLDTLERECAVCAGLSARPFAGRGRVHDLRTAASAGLRIDHGARDGSADTQAQNEIGRARIALETVRWHERTVQVGLNLVPTARYWADRELAIAIGAIAEAHACIDLHRSHR